MNLVASNIYYTYMPLSISTFNRVKNDPQTKAELNKASLYLIAKHEVPIISVIEKSELSRHLTGYNKDQFVLLRIELKQADCHIDAAYILPPEINRDDFISTISVVTVEDLLFWGTRNYGSFLWAGEISSFCTYEMLYVGQCVGEDLTTRFKAHHALQDMLIEERAISPDFDKTDEIILFPCAIDGYTFSSINGKSSPTDLKKALTNDFNFGTKEITLDSEKALVHNLTPKYNEIVFLNYPESTDGLFNTDANAYSYFISELSMFKYNSGILQGCPNPMYASTIVGDKNGNTTIYGPGENISGMNLLK